MRSELEALIGQWHVEASSRMRSAKAYKCRSMDGERSGLIKSALAMRNAADQVQAILDAEAAIHDIQELPKNT
jgi:hypothetical protein